MIRTRRFSLFRGINQQPVPLENVTLADYDAQFCRWSGATITYSHVDGVDQVVKITYHCGQCGCDATVGPPPDRYTLELPEPRRCRGPA